MTTSEKLLVQIFETKNRIIEQVKHQTELYNRHLASKAILHGVTPPSWLFNPTTSLHKELSKEDLISELLPHGPSSRPPVRYSVAGSSQYSKPFITDFREVSAGFGTEAHASNKDGPDVGEGQSTIVEGRECVDPNTSNHLPEHDVGSPADVVDVRISNIFTDPDRSLARIQRSRSRQKAIEQRNSATSQAKRNSGNEGTPRASSSGNRLFSLDYEQTGHISDSNIPAEPSAISNAKQSTCYLRDENNIGPCSNELKALGPEQVHSVNETPRSDEPFSTNSEGCRVKSKSETDDENLGEGYNDHAVPVSMSERSGKSCSLEKLTPRNSEAEFKESNILNKFSVTSLDIVEINEGTGDGCRNEKGVNRLFSLDYEQTGHISDSSIRAEPSAISNAKQFTCYLRDENNIGTCSSEIKLKALGPEQVHSVNEPPRSAEPFSISSEGCRVKGKSHNELEAYQNNRPHLTSNEAASRRSNPLNTIDDVKFSSEQGCGLALELQMEEEKCYSTKNYENIVDHSQEISETHIRPRWTENAAESTLGGLFEGTNPSYLSSVYATNREDEQISDIKSDDCPLGIEKLCCSERISSAGRSSLQVDGPQPQHSYSSPLNKDLKSMIDCWGNQPESFREDGYSKRKSVVGEDGILAQSVQSTHMEEPSAISNAKQSTCYLREENNIGTCSNEIKLKALGPEQVHSVNEPPRSAEPFSISSEGCRVKGISHNELEAYQNNRHLTPNEAASRRSNPLNTIDDVKLSSEQGCGLALELQMEEEKCYSTKNYKNIVDHSQEISEAHLCPRWTENAAESTLGGLFEVTTPSYLGSVYATNREDEQISDIKSDDCPLGIEKLCCSERISSAERSSLQVDGPQPQHSDPSPLNKDLESMIDCWGNQPESFREDGYSKRKSVVREDGILAQSAQSTHMEELCAKDADQSLPELELFLVDSQSENDSLDFPGHTTNFDNLELPRSTIARVSMLERLCKSASAYTPLSHFASAFEMERVSDQSHSLPNGLSEHTDLGGVHFRNKDGELWVNLTTSSEDEGGLQGVPLTNSLSCSGAPTGFPAVNGFSSPEGRFWEGGYSSRSTSSSKRLSSNPEFECFTIKEDPCSSEGNESADDDSDKLSKKVDSLTVNSHATDSDKFLDIDSLTVHAAREPSTETNNKFKSFLCSSHKKKGMAKDSQTPLLVVSGKRMAKDSINNTYKKLKTSGKASLRSEHLNRIREPHRNIVSDVASFIPLVQQKQAAAKACPAKREIKVKALEAAEAAKRMEEKRENDRKLKKEALQKERARTMEQEKAKQIELIRKKKEDEQRRKDADMLLRKRLREEEERKEERKRTRTEEIQRKQRELEEKLRTKKAGNKDSKRKSNHELKPQQMKKPGEQVKLDNVARPAATSSSNILKASPKESSYADLCDNKQVNCTPDKAKTSCLIRDNIQEKSYEISPYHCSDGEDDEDDELHTKKFIPAWASKNLVAESLSLMREVDPSVIFPLESCCSLDEVLLPRKLQQVQSTL